jgi:hypothetical protein
MYNRKLESDKAYAKAYNDNQKRNASDRMKAVAAKKAKKAR